MSFTSKRSLKAGDLLEISEKLSGTQKRHRRLREPLSQVLQPRSARPQGSARSPRAPPSPAPAGAGHGTAEPSPSPGSAGLSSAGLGQVRWL